VAVTEQLGRLDWGFSAVGSAGSGVIALPRGKVLGGSGAINGCIWLRGLPEDFALWERMVGPGWSWPALLPAYRAIEAGRPGTPTTTGAMAPSPSTASRRPRGQSQAAFRCLPGVRLDGPCGARRRWASASSR
jgi:choline dehydrogenase-like flavoprotein